MAKFDKNIKNEFLDADNFYEEDDLFEEEDNDYGEEGRDYYDELADSGDTAADRNDRYEESSDDDLTDMPEETGDSADTDDSGSGEISEDLHGEESPESGEEPSKAETSGASQGEWYVVHTYSGHEKKVKDNIEKLVGNRGMQDLIPSVVIPMEDVIEIKNSQRKVKNRKMFPGYVLVKMVMTSETWYLVRNTQGVTGFVGHGSDPIPLTEAEVQNMGIERNLVHLDLEVGDTIKVTNGPFDGYMGVVEEINTEKQTVRARISMFGRETPVELEYGRIEKV